MKSQSDVYSSLKHTNNNNMELSNTNESGLKSSLMNSKNIKVNVNEDDSMQILS
jgi:hypothetical protein